MLASEPQARPSIISSFSKIAIHPSRSWTMEERGRIASCSMDRRGERAVLESKRWPQAHGSDWRTRGSLKRDGSGLLRTAGRGKECHGRPIAQSVPKAGAQMPPGTSGQTSNELDANEDRSTRIGRELTRRGAACVDPEKGQKSRRSSTCRRALQTRVRSVRGAERPRETRCV